MSRKKTIVCFITVLFILTMLPVTTWGECDQGIEGLNGLFVEEEALLDDLKLVDCLEGPPGEEPYRQVLQIIDNTFHKWREYRVGPGGEFCIILEEPERRLLTAGEARELLLASRGWQQAALPPGDMAGYYPQGMGLPGDSTPDFEDPWPGPDDIKDASDPVSAISRLESLVDLEEKDIEKDMTVKEIDDEKFFIQAVIGQDDRERVSLSGCLSYPWNTIGYIELDYFYGLYRGGGTGFLISPYVALTNAHLLYDSDYGGWFHSLSFYPGQYQAYEGADEVRLYGGKTAYNAIIPTSYQTYEGNLESSTPHDYGAIKFETPFSDITTFMPLEFNVRPSYINLAGYPRRVQGEENSMAMWHSFGRVTGIASQMLYYNADSTPGTSGAPVWAYNAFTDISRVVGVHATGGYTSNAGPRLTYHNQGLIEDWMRWTPYPVETAHIPDTGLKQALRDALEMPTGDITVQDMEYITTLDARGMGIRDLTGLEHALNLEYLSFYDNQVSDLSPLSGLRELLYLDFGENQVSNIGPLASLTNLEVLFFDDNKVTGVDVLANLKKLEELYFWDNQVSNMAPLAGLTNLIAIDFSGNKVNDIRFKSGLVNLQFVYFGDNQVSDLSPLANLTGLEWLWISGNKISNINPLGKLTNLERLNVENNQVSDISPLAGLAGLELLYLNENQVKDIGPLAGLRQLQELNIQHNNLDISQGSEAWILVQQFIAGGVEVEYLPQNDRYTLTYNAGTGGSISGDAFQEVFPGGDGAAVVAVPLEGYRFSGWSDGVGTATRVDTDVTGDLNVTANFSLKGYTVTFRDHDGTVLKLETVGHGGNATAPVDPTRAGYTFIGWDKGTTNITSDLEVRALYRIKQHTVIFKDYDGSVIKSLQVNHGSSAAAPVVPARAGYSFAGWDGSFVGVKGDLEITALYHNLVAQRIAASLDEVSGEYIETKVEGYTVLAVIQPGKEGTTLKRAFDAAGFLQLLQEIDKEYSFGNIKINGNDYTREDILEGNIYDIKEDIQQEILELVGDENITSYDQLVIENIVNKSIIIVFDQVEITLSMVEEFEECFIATAAFGSRLSPAVRLLRRFRDEILSKSGPGQALVNHYYRVSPPAAGHIAQNIFLKTLAQAFLLPAVAVACLALDPGWSALAVALACGVLKQRRRRVF